MPENHFKFAFDARARLVFILLAGVFTTLAALPVLAAVESEQTINWGVMGMQLFGGLALTRSSIRHTIALSSAETST